MSNYPTIEKLFNAIIKDCYDYLFSHTDDKARESITKLFDYNKDKDEIIQKSYIVLCSIIYEKASEEELNSIYEFTKKFIESIYSYLSDAKKNNNITSTINDCCNGYIAIFGYVYIFKGVFVNEFLQFFTQDHKYFKEVLTEFNILNEVKMHYENSINKLYKEKSIIIDDQLFNEFISYFEEESFDFKKVEKEKKENEKVSLPQKLNAEIKKDEISENGNKSTQHETFDSSIIQIENKSLEDGELVTKKKTLNNNPILLKNDILCIIIKKSYSYLTLLEKTLLKIEFKSAEIDSEKKKVKYLENSIISLKQTIINLGNPYNFNLWRKLSNIILKNLFVILHKKKYKLLQYCNRSVLKSLQNYESKFKGEKLTAFKDKVKKYEERLNGQIGGVQSSGASAADKERAFNIIVVENQIKYSLVIDFLFFLKEKGNKINHFDEEIIDLILFDDLGIDMAINEDSHEKDMNTFQTEKENKQSVEKFSKNSKTSFNFAEIIDILKNPFKYHQKDINIDKIYTAIYEKITRIKTDIGYDENIKLNDIKKEIVELSEEIQNVVDSYEQYFTENKINYQNKNEKEILDTELKKHMKNYIYIKELQETINKKIPSYENIINALSDLKTITEKCMKEVEELTEEIKIKRQTEEKTLKTISEVFFEFKNTLKKDIMRKEEYKKYANIFSEENINEFSLEDVYAIIEETLNFNNTSFSITKKDITNFNLLVEVITNFEELKCFEYNKDLDVLI